MCEIIATDGMDDVDPSCLVTSIVTAIADAEGVEPHRLDICLADYVDCDALQCLYAHSSAREIDLSVRFSVEGYDVVVDGPDEVVVSQPCDAPDRCRTESLPT